MYAKYFYKVIDKHLQNTLSVKARKALADDLEELTSKPLFPRKVAVKAESRCICCLGEIQDSFDGDKEESWSAPDGAIAFKDTGNFGSRLNDSGYDGHYFEVLICDECLEERRYCVQEVDSVGAVEARMEASQELAKILITTEIEEIEENLVISEEEWTPERGRIWAEQAIAKAKEERKQRLLEQARKLLRENGEI